MMIIMQFTFQIILLSIGFGVGYFLLFHAGTQQGNLKIIGQTLGGILIIMAMILSIFSCYYSMKISNRDYMQSGCAEQKNMVQQDENSVMNNDREPDEGTQVQDDESEPNMDDENRTGGQPIKSDIKDHE